MGGKTKTQLARQYTRIKGIDGSVADDLVLSLVANNNRTQLSDLVAGVNGDASDNGSRKALFVIAPASCGMRYRTISNRNKHDVKRIDDIGNQYIATGSIDQHLGYPLAKLVRRQLRFAGWSNNGKFDKAKKLQRFERDGIDASMSYSGDVHLIVN